MGKIFKNYSDLIPLYHLTAIFAGMYLGCSFTKCIFIMSIQDVILKLEPYGNIIKKKVFSWKRVILLNPDFYHRMVPYKILVFLCQSKVQDGCHYSANLT